MLPHYSIHSVTEAAGAGNAGAVAPPPVHRRARHQLGAQGPGSLVLRMVPAPPPVAGDPEGNVSRPPSRIPSSLAGGVGRQLTMRTTCSSKPTRPVMWATDCLDPHQSQRPQSMSGSGYPSSGTTAASRKSASEGANSSALAYL